MKVEDITPGYVFFLQRVLLKTGITHEIASIEARRIVRAVAEGRNLEVISGLLPALRCVAQSKKLTKDALTDARMYMTHRKLEGTLEDTKRLIDDLFGEKDKK